MVAIGTVSDGDFQDMQRPLDPQPARVVKLPPVSIDAGAELILSDLNDKPVAFSRADIDDGQVQPVSSSRLPAGAAESLAAEMGLDDNGLGLSLKREALTSIVGEWVALGAQVLATILA